MAGTDRHSSLGPDRRASIRLSMQQTDDDDDYDLQAMGISDGFRPAAGDVGTGHNAVPSHVSQPNNGRRTPPPRPSSISKPRGFDSFALQHDGSTGSGMQRASTDASHAGLTRSSSVSTDVPFVRAESPYRGPAGPSHPYQMYPQESRLARTASVATTSTVQVPDRPYIGPGGPTHPYGMYPQNTVPEGEVASEPMVTVPVGFPGLQNEYRRRLGPDGEELADIIGPDGHTEQLPPYTKYPDEAFARKARPNDQLPALAIVAGAGGIGLATRNPEFESQEDLYSPSRQSTRSFMSDQSSHQVNVAALGSSEKPELKKWQKFARRKLCGIVPYWALGLAAAVLVLFGIILGIVLAALKPKHPTKHHPLPPSEPGESVVYTIMTTTFDSTPMTASPASLPALPTGTFSLPIAVPSVAPNTCFVNSEQSAAWACNIPMNSNYEISISGLPNASSSLHNNEISLTYGSNSFGPWYAYGAQPPILPGPECLSLVIDSQDPGRGPAWSFEGPYDKVVILPANAFSPSSNSKRHVHDRDGDDPPVGSFTTRKNVVQPGDKPWFCYWNGTLLETFIYVSNMSSAGNRQASASLMTPSSAATSTSASSVPTNVQTPSTSYSGPSGDFWLDLFPKVLKIEERRIPRGASYVKPYCIQNILDPNGVPHTLLNATTGQPNIIHLNETEPSFSSGMVDKRDAPGHANLQARDLTQRQSPNICGCVWMWT